MPARRRLLTLGAGLLLPPAARAATRVLVIATGEIPPYVSERPEDSFLSELFDAIGPEMGARFEFRFMPWRRCELALDELSAWGAVPYVPTAEREKKYLFSAPLYTKQTKLFYYSPSGRPPLARFEQLSELRPLRIGGVRGYYYEQMFHEAGLQLDFALSEEQNFRKLRAGRVDLVPALEPVGWELIRRLFPPEEARFFNTVSTPLHVGFNFLMSSRRYPQTPDLLEQFNSALDKLRRNAVYKQIAERHGLPPG